VSRSSSAKEHAAWRELERQVERGNLFTHTALSESFSRLGEAETFLYGLIDLLIAKGIITEQELKEVLLAVRQERVERGEHDTPGIVIQQEAPEGEPQPEAIVDCAARMPVCHAICCKLQFALTISEIEAGQARWDLGRPYLIRQGEDRYCIHCQQETGQCGIYAHRPGVCRRYNCSDDARIWSDFEQMELNTAWIEEYLNSPERVRGAVMGQTTQMLPLIQITPRKEIAKQDSQSFGND
jgi:Fe-S-cluster containining protein